MKYAKYEVASGDIVAIIQCPEAEAANQATPGTGMLELPNDFEGDGLSYRVVDGALEPL